MWWTLLWWCVIQCYTEEVIDEMTQEITMATVPQALEMHREMHGGGAGTFDPTKSAVLSTIAQQEHENWFWHRIKNSFYGWVICISSMKIINESFQKASNKRPHYKLSHSN